MQYKYTISSLSVLPQTSNAFHQHRLKQRVPTWRLTCWTFLAGPARRGVGLRSLLRVVDWPRLGLRLRRRAGRRDREHRSAFVYILLHKVQLVVQVAAARLSHVQLAQEVWEAVTY